MTPQPTSPRTAAGRALLEALPRFFKGHAYWRDFEPSAPDRILAIEAEAAAEPTALLRALDKWGDGLSGGIPEVTPIGWDNLRAILAAARAYLEGWE